MKVFVTPSRDEIGRFVGITHAFPKIWEGKVLDVGCRSEGFKRALYDQNVYYKGLDLSQPADIIGNLEIGLPFSNESFDVVVALDVLEHTNNIYHSFNELCRVARKYVVIALPNIYDIRFRAKFLKGHPLSGKYGLPAEPVADRHRWLFSFKEARSFCHHRANLHGFKILDEGCYVGPRRGFPIVKFLVSIFPNLLSPRYLVLIGRKNNLMV